MCGATFHLLGGQPLTILGSTGPMLVFETIVHDLCIRHGFEYLSFRFWVNLWIVIYLLILVATDASSMVRNERKISRKKKAMAMHCLQVKYISRFTEESFATLIALIFIVESCKKLYNIIGTYAHIVIYDPVISSFQILYILHFLQTNQWATCECTPPENATVTDYTKWARKTMKMRHLHSDWLHNQSWFANLCTLEGKSRYHRITTDGQNVTDIDYHSINLDFCQQLKGHLLGNGCYRVHNVFFMSLLLAIGTYVIATWLKNLRLVVFHMEVYSERSTDTRSTFPPGCDVY